MIAGLGLAFSLMIENVHRQLHADVTYASFCNVNSSVNCDVVLTSAYSSLFGISVGVWAALYYGALLAAGLVVLRETSASRRETLATAIFAVSCLGILFSLYMAFISLMVLGTICLLCSGLYLIAIGMLVAAWMLRNSTIRSRPKDIAGRERLERLAWGLSGALVAIVVGAVALQSFGGGQVLSAKEIEAQRPDFYRWYFSRPVVDVPADGGNSRGGADAPVTIVEFSDFGCSHCAAFDRNVGEILRGNDSVRLVFRHFPLDSACNPAVTGAPTGQRCEAAVAAECAGEQGRFWQYGRTLFQHQPHFSASELRDYAAEIGLEMGAFETCLKSADARARVERDAKAGAALEVKSTPTVFINGRRIEGDLGADLVTALVLARTPR
jgi:protein-disulfide isomerase/uncharacterized membrane protein